MSQLPKEYREKDFARTVQSQVLFCRSLYSEKRLDRCFVNELHVLEGGVSKLCA